MHDVAADISWSFSNAGSARSDDCAFAKLPEQEKRTQGAVTLRADSVHLFQPEALTINVDNVLRLQGYKNLDRVRPAVRSLAEAMVNRAKPVLLPRVYYRRVAISERRADSVILANGSQFCSPAFEKYLRDCTDIVAFIVTMGSAVDKTEQELIASEKLLEAVLLESVAWLGIEDTSRNFSLSLVDAARQSGLHLTRRMSPGYSFRVEDRKVEWPLEQQTALFELFGDVSMEVQLLPSCAMTPKMSRSSIFGLFPRTASSSGRSEIFSKHHEKKVRDANE